MTEVPQMDKQGLRKFGLVTGLFVILLFGLILPWWNGKEYPYWPWLIGTVLSVLALAIPNSLGPLYYLWMRIGAVLGLVNTTIILGLFFIIVITPIAIVMRISGRDTMNKRKNPVINSYRIQSPNLNPKRMEELF